MTDFWSYASGITWYNPHILLMRRVTPNEVSHLAKATLELAAEQELEQLFPATGPMGLLW